MYSYFLFSKHWNALALLYKSARRNRRALEIWAKLGNGEYKDADFDGIDQTVELLSQTTDLELVVDFSPWIYKKDPKKFEKIFLSTSGGSERLPTREVISFLSGIEKNLIISYLEHLVFTLDTQQPVYHAMLTMHYLDTIKTLLSSSSQPSTGSFTGQPRLSIGAMRQGEEPGLLGVTRTKLQKLLQKSQLLEHDQILQRINEEPSLAVLTEEKLQLYSKLGNHKKCLEIFVENMRDFDRAESYCLEHHKDDDLISDSSGSEIQSSPTPSPFLLLLSIYVSKQADLEYPKKAVELLTKYPTKFDPIAVLEILPTYTPISVLTPYLTKSMRRSQHVYRDGLVVKNLEKIQNIRVKAQKLRYTTKCVTMTKSIVCRVCGNKINLSVFGYYPNGSVVHFSCIKNKHVDPVSGFNFLTNTFENNNNNTSL
eukprot:TRINITY_DN10520_c0_g2_i1.p1 TRINITY_DN10520_c0_g2~~TRINITY_DN10520_c0_g2_i1.p1  ORF type:complete len:426 (-),score=52.37 TRINITY_DN10520_c0_g2_i1:26-1303(-)